MKVPTSFPRCVSRSLGRIHPSYSISRSQAIRTLAQQKASKQLDRPLISYRPLTTSLRYHIKLDPGTSDPKAPKTQSHPDIDSHTTPADLSDSEYHEVADTYINALVLALEEKAEASSEIEVEYSVRSPSIPYPSYPPAVTNSLISQAGVLTLTTPRGTYIINKQPPNKQIWLSSPVSGPKRFDWVLPSTNVQQYEKQDTEDEDDGGDDGQGGKWVYLRDKSTLTAVLRREVDVRVKGGDEGEGFRAL
jgi:frataxin